MPSPFPGMDPYLESPELWRGFHARLITYDAGPFAERIDYSAPSSVALNNDDEAWANACIIAWQGSKAASPDVTT
jgi:hypothetical protein